MDNGSYFSRSWAQMTRNPGWIKPILVLALALLVPIVGPLGVLGYQLEWARLSAWGVDASPKQKGVRVGECIASGWRGFWVLFVWGLAWALVGLAFTALMRLLFRSTGEDLASGIMMLAGYFAGLVLYAACVREAVYAKIGAGLNFVRVFELVRKDPKGLLAIVAIPLIGTLIMCAILVVLALVLVATSLSELGELVGVLYYLQGEQGLGDSVAVVAITILGEILAKALPILIIFGYALSVVWVALMSLEINSIGLWMAQFDVARWGDQADPLPEKQGLPGAVEG